MQQPVSQESPDTFVGGISGTWGEYESGDRRTVLSEEYCTNIEGFRIPFYSIEGTRQLKSFTVRSDDIYVCSYPKSGTTWLQQVIYLILHGSESAQTETKVMEERFPFLEYMVSGVENIDKMPSPRLIKSHLPMSLLPPDITVKRPKIFCVVRNPKDVVVSLHFFTRMFKYANYNGKLEDMYSTFITDKAPYSPWAEHVKQYWERREDDNVLFLTYEDMSQDLSSCVRRVGDFLGKSLQEEEVLAITRECSFNVMKENDMANYSWWNKAGLRKQGETEFMRKGRVGNWKSHLTQEMSENIDRMLAEKITPLGLQMTCDLNRMEEKCE